MFISPYFEIKVKGAASVSGVPFKKFECSVVPVEGMYFENRAWTGPKLIDRVRINPEEDTYFIRLEPFVFDTSESCDQFIASLRECGWQVG